MLNSGERLPAIQPERLLLVMMVGCLLGCPQPKRPTVPKDVPVQAPTPSPSLETGETLESHLSDLPLTVDDAIYLEFSEATKLQIPGGAASDVLWFRLPIPKKMLSSRLSLSGGPNVRWGLRLFRGESPDTMVLKTHQPEPGHPCRVSGIQVDAVSEPLWVQVTRIWRRKNQPMTSLRLFIEAAIARPGEEVEPDDLDPQSPPRVPEKGRREGILSHPGDLDCLAMPQSTATDSPEATPLPPKCFSVTLHLVGPSRRPFQLEKYAEDGSTISAQTVRAPGEIVLAPAPNEKLTRFCMKVDDGTSAPIQWWAEADPIPCRVYEEDVPEEQILEQRFTIGPGQPKVISNQLASQDAEHSLIVKSLNIPVLVRVEGPVSAVWSDPTLSHFLLPPNAEGKLLVRIDEPPNEGDAPFRYWVQLKPLDPRPVHPPTNEPIQLSSEGIYSSITPNASLMLKLPEQSQGNWKAEHLGERNSPALKFNLLDADQRTVTTRKIQPGKKATLKLPAGFGPYTATVKAESQTTRPIAFSFSSESPAEQPTTPPTP